MSEAAQFTVRTMTIDDLAAIYHMGDRIYSDGGHLMLYRTWDPYEVTKLYNNDPDTCMVAEHEGELIGFALGTIIEKSTAWSYGYIVWLGIHEDWRGQRVGHRLLRVMEKRMCDDGVRMFLVDTAAANHSAIGFFEREGFEISEPHVYLSKTLRGNAEERKRRATRRAAASVRPPRPRALVDDVRSQEEEPGVETEVLVLQQSAVKKKKPSKKKKPAKKKKTSRPKVTKVTKATKVTKVTKATKATKPAKPAKPARAARVAKSAKPAKPGRSSKVTKASKPSKTKKATPRISKHPGTK